MVEPTLKAEPTLKVEPTLKAELTLMAEPTLMVEPTLKVINSDRKKVPRMMMDSRLANRLDDC